MTATQLQELARTAPRSLAKAFAATLRDFGYPITPDLVETYLNNFQAGMKPKGGPEGFVHHWLTDGMED